MTALVERPIQFESEGATLRGYIITMSGATTQQPGVILAHGTSATLRMVAIEYARVFARAGLTALIYDHRNIGSSDGEPRGEINPWIQCRGYLDALTFAERCPEIDASRLGIWGDSAAGAEVVLVGACDSRPQAIIAQTPSLGTQVPDLQPTLAVFEQIRETFRSGDVRGTPQTTTGPLPVVSFDQSSAPSLLTPIQAFRWFIDYGGRPGSGWVNRVTRVIPPTSAPYSPFLCAPFVKARTLFMASPSDEMVHANYQVTRQAYELLTCAKEWYDIEDGHFGLIYHPGERFEEASRGQVKFLSEALTRG
jgi:hypothetical protein